MKVEMITKNKILFTNTSLLRHWIYSFYHNEIKDGTIRIRSVQELEPFNVFYRARVVFDVIKKNVRNYSPDIDIRSELRQ